MSPSRRFSTPSGRRRQAVFVLLVGAVAAFAGYGTAALQRAPTTPPTTAKAESAISANERTVSGLAQSALPPTSALGVIDVDLTLVRVPSNGLVQVMVGLEQAGTQRGVRRERLARAFVLVGRLRANPRQLPSAICDGIAGRLHGPRIGATTNGLLGCSGSRSRASRSAKCSRRNVPHVIGVSLRRVAVVLIAIGASLVAAGAPAAASTPSSALARPVVSSISPTLGPTTGGTPVLIHGRRFPIGSAGIRVQFGQVSVPATCTTTILCSARAPVGHGTVRVTLATRRGTSAASSATRFAYLVPLSESAARLSTELQLSATTVAAGSHVSGTLIIDNAGPAVITTGCGPSPHFAVGLTNSEIAFNPAFPAIACVGNVVIQPGTTSYPFELVATYVQCSANASQATPSSPACDGPPDTMPPLPAGLYQTKFVTEAIGVPTPPSISVTLVSP